MYVEISIKKEDKLPLGAEEALEAEMLKRLSKRYDDVSVRVRRGQAGISVMGGSKQDKEDIMDILQETWESADDWFDLQ